jgi:cation diffusion facilitator family transporter
VLQVDHHVRDGLEHKVERLLVNPPPPEDGGEGVDNEAAVSGSRSRAISTVSALSEVFDSSKESRVSSFATSASWVVNWFLLIAKLIAVILTSSKAVAAALADSAVDLLSQFVMSAAEKYMAKHSEKYPVGRARLEALSVLGCAAIMIMASVEVIQFSIQDLISGFEGQIPFLDVGVELFAIMGVGIGLKLVLYLYCQWAKDIVRSDIIGALAEDHLNDVFSNIAAVVTAAIAMNTVAWWTDPVGAILISLVIIVRWSYIIKEQIRKIVGHTAPPEFIQQVICV